MTYENPFKTVYKGDYIWPYIAPISFKACKGPGWETLQAPERPDPVKMCQCDRHDFSPHFKRAHYLREKEQAFREAMLAVAAERTILDNELLHHPCGKTDDILMSIYSSDFSKRDCPIANYRTVKSDHDDPVVTPVAMIKDPKSGSYRDSSTFKRVALEPQTIHGPRPIDFSSSTQPIQCDPSPYSSEYMDKISKDGFNNIISSQRFRTVPSRDED